jgi:outer membrane lipoprotein-sorting protein
VNKNFTACIIALQLVIVAFAVQNVKSQEPTPTLAIEPAEYTANIIGETFDVNVTIADMRTDLRLVMPQFRVQYDNTALEVVDIEEGPFLKQFGNAAEPPYTFFINITDDNPDYGPSVLVGILLWPDENGTWSTFPEGSGTLATITFKATKQTAAPESPISSMLILNDTLLVDDGIGEIAHETVDGQYRMDTLSFTYSPSVVLAGKPVFFSGPEAANTVTYHWDFGDGTSADTTKNTIGHVYSTIGNYDVALNCSINDFTSSTATESITVSPSQPSLDVTIDAGSIHFNGEVVEFNVLTASHGEAVDSTKLEAYLYNGGVLNTNLTSEVRTIDTGLYLIPYGIPADAPAGTYTLLVKAEYYNAMGTNIKSFQISPTLTAEIENIKGDVATVSNGVENLRLNLTAINATITGLINSQGVTLAQISTSVGTLTTKLDTINATITQINGNTATLQSTLGEVETKLGDTQMIATTTLYATTILSAIAAILAAVILLSMRKKEPS